MNFVKVISEEGAIVWINPFCIVSIHESDDRVWIHFHGQNRAFPFRGSSDELLAAIEKATNDEEVH